MTATTQSVSKTYLNSLQCLIRTSFTHFEQFFLQQNIIYNIQYSSIHYSIISLCVYTWFNVSARCTNRLNQVIKIYYEYKWNKKVGEYFGMDFKREWIPTTSLVRSIHCGIKLGLFSGKITRDCDPVSMLVACPVVLVRRNITHTNDDHLVVNARAFVVLPVSNSLKTYCSPSPRYILWF